MEATVAQAQEGRAMVQVLAAVLERLVGANQTLAQGGDAGQVTKFHATQSPGISVRQYLERYVFVRCCDTLFVIMLYFYLGDHGGLTLIIAFLEYTSTRPVRMNATSWLSFTLTDSFNETTFS